MLSKQRQHVVKKGNARPDGSLPRAIELQPHLNAGLFRCPLDAASPDCHLAAFNQSIPRNTKPKPAPSARRCLLTARSRTLSVVTTPENRTPEQKYKDSPHPYSVLNASQKTIENKLRPEAGIAPRFFAHQPSTS